MESIEATKIKIGAGKAEIALKDSDFPLKAFVGFLGRIFVRAFLCEVSDPWLLISIEATSLPSHVIELLQDQGACIAGIPRKNVFISVTHTFSVPHIPSDKKSIDDEHTTNVLFTAIIQALSNAVMSAKTSLSYGEIDYGEAPCAINVNRNVETKKGYWIGQNKEGYSNRTLKVLRFYVKGEPVAYLINYDLQASALDKARNASGERLISGDIVGTCLEELESHVVPIAIFLPGCAGDQAPIFQARQEEDVYTVNQRVKELGSHMAECVKRAAVCIGKKNRLLCSISCTVAKVPEQKMWYETPDLTPHLTYPFTPTYHELSIPITLICLGDVNLLLCAPELNSEFGVKLQQYSKNPLMIGTLVNGAMKYLPEEKDFEHITYAAMNTKLGRGSAEIFLHATEKLLKEGEEC